jgi:glutamine cyclotransferase
MTKTKPKRRKSFPPGLEDTSSKAKPQQTSTLSMDDKRPIRWDLVVLFLVISIGGTYLAIAMRPKTDAPRYTYELVKKYPHDGAAFTQGLVMDDGFLWESTGRKGKSTIRKTNLETGEVLAKSDLDDKYFGEGLALHGDKFYQLTWKGNKAFVYDRDFKKLNELEFEGQGWGLTSNGKDLIFSDGSSELMFLDPETFEVRRSIRVRRGGLRVGQLNELEFFGGKIYANCYQTDFIYEIDPETGQVTAVIDLTGLWPLRERPADGVLNGIAINPESGNMLVTGKLCPTIFEIKLLPAE